MPSKYHAWKKAVRKADPPAYDSIIAHQPDDRPYIPAGMGFKAQVYQVCLNTRVTEPVRSGLTYADKMAAVSSTWDADRGAGTSRKAKPGVKQDAGYTARTKNPDAKPVKGIAPEVIDAHQTGRMMTWGKAL